MSWEQLLFVKILYIVGLVALGLALALAVQHGIDGQVDALPYYAEVWGR